MNIPIKAEIHGLSHDGRGIATINGITTFVEGALPGETALCEILKRHKNYHEAKALEISNPSDARTTPLCPHFGICGGCSMQHVKIDHQILFKQQVLLEQLQHFGKVKAETILPPITGEPWGYRRRARLGVRYVKKKEKVLVGFREKMSHYLAELKTCDVLQRKVGYNLTALSDMIASLSQFQQIPQIEVALGDKECALVFRHMTDLPQEDLDKLSEFGEKNQMSIYLQPNPPKPITKLFPKNSPELLSYFLPDYQLEMQFHPLDFVQVNGEVNQLMLRQALKLLDPQPNEKILDLFCGLGNFTLPLAKYAKQVVGIEGDQKMVQRAYENAKLNNISNVEFYATNLMDTTNTINALNQKYDKILLDPPRTGAKEIIPLVAAMYAKCIVYVSCNPATLARDAGELVNTYGYQLKQVGVINMFPHTNHIEAIACFEAK